jgi:hypothetical protein
MAKFHVVDEAVIAARPEEIAAMPALKMRSRDGRRFDESGAIADHWVYREGRDDRPWPTSSHK